MVRLKHRYFVVEINIEEKNKIRPFKLRPFAFYESIINKVQQLHGDYGVALIKAGFVTKYCNELTRIALIRTRHGPHTILASSLPFITNIDGKSVVINIKYVGATMKQCFKFIKNYQTNKLNEIWNTLKNDNEKKSFESAIMDLNSADASIKIKEFDNDMPFVK